MLEDFLKLGWKIFPCHSIMDGKCTCGKRDCGSPGKHPRTRQGVKDASNDPAVVAEWHRSWPETNWGLACGKESNVIVIDIDQKSGGFGSIDEYEGSRRLGPLPTSLISLTGGGGRHLFYSYPAGLTVGNRVNWLPGVDVRSDGGYVILPPGTHVSGGTYRWHNFQDVTLSEMPADVAGDITNKTNASGQSMATPDMDLTNVAGIVEGLREGSRDDTLFRWACRLRRQHAGDADGGRAAVTVLIMAAAQRANFPKEEAVKCIESAFKQDHTDEMEEKELRSLDDVGNRDRFLDIHGDDLRYVPELGWLRWGDIGWQVVPGERVCELTEDVSLALIDEKATLVDAGLIKEYDKFIKYSRSSGGLSAIEKLARQSKRILRSVDDFDTKLTELACSNGIVNLETGELRPFSRMDLVTKNTNVRYVPGLKSVQWQKFLDGATGGDLELQEYLQMAAGYTATGLCAEEVFFVISGPTASGKSTYLDAIMNALGSYFTTTQSETFMYRRGRDASPQEIARLAGVRGTGISEIREGDSFNDELVKQVTGGDRVTGRHLYKTAFEYTPQFKLWIATNHDPSSTDAALMRRLKRIMFPYTVPKEKRDPSLKQAVRREITEHILSWIVEGAMKYLAKGKLTEPAAIQDAVGDYAESQDIFKIFLEESVIVSPGSETSLFEMFTAYTQWNQRIGQYAVKLPVFRQKMNDYNHKVGKMADGRDGYIGLVAKAPALSGNLSFA
jgi:putative DNA primase/helicase